MKTTTKGDSLPDVTKKAAAGSGIVSISGARASKASKTAVVDMGQLQKEEGSGTKKASKKAFSETKLKAASKSISKASGKVKLSAEMLKKLKASAKKGKK